MEINEDKLRAVMQYLFGLHETDAVVGMLQDEDYTADDICEYINWGRKRYEEDLDTEFDSWLDDRKTRVTIGFSVTEAGCPIAGTLDFPKRGEDMEHGTEYEWYYSLREITDKIMALKVGETIPFKIRDDKDSVGSVTRLK